MDPRPPASPQQSPDQPTSAIARPGVAAGQSAGSGGAEEEAAAPAAIRGGARDWRRGLAVWGLSALGHLVALLLLGFLVMYRQQADGDVATRQKARPVVSETAEIQGQTDILAEAREVETELVDPEIPSEVETFVAEMEVEVPIEARELADVERETARVPAYFAGGGGGTPGAFLQRAARRAPASGGGVAQGAEHDGSKPRGEISIVLEWDWQGSNDPGGPDIDIRVLDGARRTLSTSREGFALGPTPEGGRIDFDDRGRVFHDGGGPERVYWPRGLAPEGAYRIWVRYFGGSGTADFRVTVYEGERAVLRESGRLTRPGQVVEVGRHRFERNRQAHESAREASVPGSR